MNIEEKIQRIIKIMQPDSSRITIAGNEYEYQYFVYLEYDEERFDILYPEEKYNNRFKIEHLLEKICNNRVCFFIVVK